MAARTKNHQFPTAYKLKAIKRAEGGEVVLPVARKLGYRANSCTTDQGVEGPGPRGVEPQAGAKAWPPQAKSPSRPRTTSARHSPRRTPASPNSSGGRPPAGGSRFFSQSLARLGRPERKANPHPHHRSHRSHDVEADDATPTFNDSAGLPACRARAITGIPTRPGRPTPSSGSHPVLCLKHRLYGYRRITAHSGGRAWLSMPSGFSGLCARTISWPSARRHSCTTSSRHGFPIVPNLVRGLVRQRLIRSGSPTSPMSAR